MSSVELPELPELPEQLEPPEQTGGFARLRALAHTLAVVFGLFVVALIIWWGAAMLDKSHRVAWHVETEDDIRSLIYMTRNKDGAISEEHQQHVGRNFILTVVADGKLPAGGTRGLKSLWPYNAAEREDIDRRTYEQVTWESLAVRRFPHLTGLAGPRDPRSTTEPIKGLGVPLIADTTHPDGVIVGMSSGSGALLTWSYLKMDRPDGPLVVGANATHPLLRALSIG